METSCLLLPLLLSIITANAAATFSGGVDIGSGGGGRVWVGGAPTSTPHVSESETVLHRAYIALQAWKSAITEDPHGVTRSWVGCDVCSYKGVFCLETKDFKGNTIAKTVASIDLNHANLKGFLVKELALLSDLRILHLNSNRFTGIVPLSFKEMFSLAELDLSNNHFAGPFPFPVLYIPNLVYLDLRFNSFCGPIPLGLFYKQLDAIFLNDNQFDGELPPSLGNSPASVINLANNRFTGSIPFSLGYMGVKEILFLNNKLTGCIPEGVGLWSGLEVLDVSSNSLMGSLPNSLSCLTGLEVLNFAHNKLSGELPEGVCSLRSLSNLTVAGNFFSGFSPGCSRLFFRNCGFNFSMNCIPGWRMQRPQPECTAVGGGGFSCLRIPAVKPVVQSEFAANPTP